jgi:hypothetical protein
MPLTTVYLRHGLVLEELPSEFDVELRKAVAETLTCTDPEGSVGALEVEVHYVNRTKADRASDGVFVLVETQRCPARESGLIARTDQLKGAIALLLPSGMLFSAVIKLVDWEWVSGVGSHK